MRALLLLLALAATWTASPAFAAAPVRLVKVLPHLVDKQGRVALNPSLYERDAYQAHLRKTPAEQGGLRFDVQWKTVTADRLTLRLELRGSKSGVGTSTVVEEKVRYTGFFSTWSKVHLTGPEYARLGELSAWRATLWDGDKLMAEQKSFLW